MGFRRRHPSSGAHSSVAAWQRGGGDGSVSGGGGSAKLGGGAQRQRLNFRPSYF